MMTMLILSSFSTLTEEDTPQFIAMHYGHYFTCYVAKEEPNKIIFDVRVAELLAGLSSV
jgi:hypothetical protein